MTGHPTRPNVNYGSGEETVAGIGEGPVCDRCGGDLDAGPDHACGCDPLEEQQFPSPWIWTDDGMSPGPGLPDDDEE